MNVALIGNQNSGKSTLFNLLTGKNQKIGNWPGVTIDKKVGVIKNTNINVVDLPGVYSLKAYTSEEKVTSDYVYNENVDALINVVDCNCISRGLYLSIQIKRLNIPVIIVLNMYDIAEKKGIFIDEKELSKQLDNTPIIKISALTGEGCDRLVNELLKIKNVYKNNFKISKLEANEKEIDTSYKNIDFIVSKSVRNNNIKKASLTDILDKIFLNKYLAIPIFVAIMFDIYYFSIEVVGGNTAEILESFKNIIIGATEEMMLSNDVNKMLVSLLINGIINSLISVISFLPQLIFLFIAISFLEKIGYMSRISLIFHKLLNRIGLSGNSIISFIIGTGCSVPGIMATKTIKNDKEKKSTVILTPFIPCSAKLPIISLFSTYFFREKSGLVAISFYLLSILVIVISAILFKKINNNSNEISYISELPEYRLPKVSQILRDSFERVLDFLKKAGSIIMISSIVVWILLSFCVETNKEGHFINLKPTDNIENSILASIGKGFSWLFVPMVGTNNWQVAVSSIQGLIAKEQVISSMAVISGLENENISGNIFSNGSPFNFFTPLSAYSFVCFNLFSAPCIAAISAMKKELGSNKRVIQAILYQIGLAYIISCLIFNVGEWLL